MISSAVVAAYAGLFITSLLAATILPLGSESVFVAMALAGYSPAIILFVATAGNTLGAVFNYQAGYLGERALHRRYAGTAMPTLQRARQIMAKWGPPAMILAWAPVIGDPLTLLAGISRMPFGRFFFWMSLGKGLRYGVLLWAAGRIQPLLQ